MGHVLGSERVTWHGGDASQGDGFLRRLDPRARIVAAVAFAVAVVALEDLAALTLAVAFALATMAHAQLPVGRTLRRMAAMDSFIVFMLAMLPFTVPGDPMFVLWGLTASWQGLLQAVQIALKANAIVLMLMSLVGTMESVTLGHALYRLRVPESLVHLLLFTVRYIEVMHREYLRLRTAMKARGFRPANTRHTYRTFGYLIGMMLVRALERSERILQAMKCRGFAGRIPLLEHLRFAPRDGAFAALFTVALVALVVTELQRVATF